MRKSDEKLYQLTLRLPEVLYREIESFTENNGMTITEFLRRASREKLDRENGTAPDAQVSRAEFEELKRRFAELEEDADAMKKFLEATRKENGPEEA